jgi:hypothetical protein
MDPMLPGRLSRRSSESASPGIALVTSDTPTRGGRAKWPDAPCKGLSSDKATHIEDDDFGVERQSLLLDWHGRSDLVTSW